VEIIEPIDNTQQQLVVETTGAHIARASKIFDTEFKIIPVRFDLRGRSAGMYRVKNSRRHIRYNPYLFAKYFDDNLADTVPHEVAHYICDRLYGLRYIRPHGIEWKSVMEALGARAVRTSNYDLEGIPLRTQRRHTYSCGCTTHRLTSRRHNRVLREEARYLCRLCGKTLSFVGPEAT
jgi:SprT protein